MNPPPRTRRRGGTNLAGYKINEKVDTSISSLGSVELAILYLLDHYDFDLSDLRDVLLRSYFPMKHMVRMRANFG
jgi:hypothetical protein